MISAFNSDGFQEEENNILIPISHPGSRRYSFFKTRINGKLHFVKKVSEEYAGDLISSEALHKEFIIGYNLDHPCIVKYLNYKDGAVYEEYIDGDSLRTIIDNDDIRLKNPSFVKGLCLHMLEAVQYIHLNGVLHLDLKPENVMITKIGSRVKIIDFNCAKSDICDSTPGFTIKYLAPGQKNGNVDCYTDIFQVGKIIQEIVEKYDNKKQWRSFINKACSEDPDKRFKNEAEAIASIPNQNNLKNKYLWIAAIFILLSGLMSVLLYRKTDHITPPSDKETSEGTIPVVSEHTSVSLNSDTLRGIERPYDMQTSNTAKTVESTSNNNLKDTVPESFSILSPQESAQDKPVVIPSGIEDDNEALKRHIDEYILKCFEDKVRPLCDKKYGKNGKVTPEQDRLVQETMVHVVLDIRKYEYKLLQEFRNKSDIIAAEFILKVDDQILQTHEWLYGVKKNFRLPTAFYDSSGKITILDDYLKKISSAHPKYNLPEEQDLLKSELQRNIQSYYDRNIYYLLKNCKIHDNGAVDNVLNFPQFKYNYRIMWLQEDGSMHLMHVEEYLMIYKNRFINELTNVYRSKYPEFAAQLTSYINEIENECDDESDWIYTEVLKHVQK